MKTVTVQQMRSLDNRTINEAGISGEKLMKTAGEGAAKEILNFIAGLHQDHIKRFIIFAGKGNNGGDAYVTARYLYENCNIPLVIYAVSNTEELKGDAYIHAKRLPKEIPHLIYHESKPIFRKGDIIIDALLGTGVNGNLRPPYDSIIKDINNSGMPVVSLDIPSGLNGNNGCSATDVVKADLTITMGLPKRGFLFHRGPELCGRLKCIDIGIPQNFIDSIPSEFNMIFSDDIKILKRRPMNSFKNKNGHILVIGGSYKYPGAPLLTAKAAMRSGAGLVTLAVPESAKITNPNMHSIIFRRVRDSGSGTFSAESIPEIKELAAHSDIIVAGPGMTPEKEIVPLLQEILSINKTIVADADALNIIAENISLIKNKKGKLILTPHYGEFKRIMRTLKVEIKEMTVTEKLNHARLLAKKTDSLIVLKGERTITTDKHGKNAVNCSGSPALATAGSGDILAGIIAACTLQGENLFDTTVSAVYIHGLCGEITKYGMRGTTADDLINLIPAAMKKISPFS
jgi:NAD(P)H-hydrate epimerase